MNPDITTIRQIADLIDPTRAQYAVAHVVALAGAAEWTDDLVAEIVASIPVPDELPAVADDGQDRYAVWFWQRIMKDTPTDGWLEPNGKWSGGTWHDDDCNGKPECDGCGWIDADNEWWPGPTPDDAAPYQEERAEGRATS